MKLILILAGCLALTFLDGLLIKHAHLSLLECSAVFGCAICSVMVWCTAMDLFINRK